MFCLSVCGQENRLCRARWKGSWEEREKAPKLIKKMRRRKRAKNENKKPLKIIENINRFIWMTRDVYTFDAICTQIDLFIRWSFKFFFSSFLVQNRNSIKLSKIASVENNGWKFGVCSCCCFSPLNFHPNFWYLILLLRLFALLSASEVLRWNWLGRSVFSPCLVQRQSRGENGKISDIVVYNERYAEGVYSYLSVLETIHKAYFFKWKHKCF